MDNRVVRLFIILSFVLPLLLKDTVAFAQRSPRSGYGAPGFQETGTDPERDLERARQLEQRGQFEEAMTLYENVLRTDPDNAQSLSALPRLYIRLSRFESAIAILQKQIDKSPRNVAGRRMLADVYFRTNREPDARTQCQAILDLYPKNEPMIGVVATIYKEHGLYEDAARTYENGRIAMGKPDAYTRDLADLYTTLVDIPNAVLEYVNLVSRQTRHFALVDERLEELFELEGEGPILEVLEKVSMRKDVKVEVLKLLGNFYLRRSRPADALAQYQNADIRNKSDGQHLLEFASLCIRERFYEESVATYMDVMNRSLPIPVLAQASLGLAEVYRTKGSTDYAAASYRLVTTRYPKTAESEEALFQIAELALTHYGDPSAALETYRTLQAASPGTARRMDVLFRVADCHIAQEHMHDAAMQYNMILDPAQSGLTGDVVQERAKFRLAELALWQGNIKEATQRFTEVATAFPAGKYANDALEWSLLLGTSIEAGEDAFAAYLDAVLLERRFKQQDALDAYKRFLTAYPDTPISDLAAFGTGVILNDQGKQFESIAAFRDLLERYPSSGHAAKAQRQIAQIYEVRLQNIPQAIAEYQAILVNFPANFHNDAIRRKIRRLTTLHPPRP